MDSFIPYIGVNEVLDLIIPDPPASCALFFRPIVVFSLLLSYFFAVFLAVLSFILSQSLGIFCPELSTIFSYFVCRSFSLFFSLHFNIFFVLLVVLLIVFFQLFFVLCISLTLLHSHLIIILSLVLVVVFSLPQSPQLQFFQLFNTQVFWSFCIPPVIHSELGSDCFLFHGHGKVVCDVLCLGMVWVILKYRLFEVPDVLERSPSWYDAEQT